MELQEAEAQLRSAATQLEIEQRRAEEATRRVSGLRKVMAGYLEMFPELERLVEDWLSGISPLDESRPRGAEAVRVILQETPNEWHPVSELVATLRDRGWLPDSENPANAVRTALQRLVASEESDIVKGKRPSGQVVYQYDPDRERPSERTYDEEPF